MRDQRAAWTVVVLGGLVASHAHAESTALPNYAGRFQLTAQSETYAELFQRALLPGADGALVTTNTVAPLQQYVLLRGRDLNVDPRRDSIDFELSAWGRAWLGTRGDEPLLDGDVQTLNVRYRHGPYALRFGRQVVAGGAARYVRFDGATVDAELGSGFSCSVYGGFSVLPRWNERPGYEQLGAAVDTLVRDPQALPDPSRSDYVLGGGRLSWTSGMRGASVSFHEQHETGGLAHRNLGLDGYDALTADTSVGANAVLDLDRDRFADARAFLDARPHERVDISLEYLHSEPALFLSHQSVLSVFGSAAYDETGGLSRVKATDWLDFDGSAFVDFYPGSHPGGRAELAARLMADRARRTLVRIGYSRVQAPENGYHALRSTVSRRFFSELGGTLEAYAYFYDHAIRSYRASTVYAATLSYNPVRALGLMLGGSLASSPYSSLDAQAELRVVYQLDALFVRRAP